MKSFFLILLVFCVGYLKSQSFGVFYTQHSSGGFGDLGIAFSYKKFDIMLGRDIPYPSIGFDLDLDPIYAYGGYNFYDNYWAYFRYGYGQYFTDDPNISTYGFIIRHNLIYFGYQFNIGHTVFGLRINLFTFKGERKQPANSF